MIKMEVKEDVDVDEVICTICSKLFTKPTKRIGIKNYCSRSCANTRVHTPETRLKISNSLVRSEANKVGRVNRRVEGITFNCLQCSKEVTKYKGGTFCNQSCSTTYRNINGQARIAGLRSAEVQKDSRRSKNEIHFHELCDKEFSEVYSNKVMFNGWDADVIIEDYKLAIMWNGNWHYQTIMKGHSLLQVQTRDRIKIKEITKMGYIPYVIEDRGKVNKSLVESEFIKLKDYISSELNFKPLEV